jgi:glycosyltransferase involved in cell wall biosynthesis
VVIEKQLRRIALVADELRGLQGGGLGTVFAFLSVALARLGHEVDVLYFGSEPLAMRGAWADAYTRWGVRVRSVPRTHERVEPSYFNRLLDVDRALVEVAPDVVIAQDLAAPAYVALRRRQLGLGLDGARFIIRCSGTRRWITDAAGKVGVHPGALEVTVLEQAALELADAVVTESRYMREWMQRQGWQLPEDTHVIPSLLRAGATGEPAPRKHSGSDGRVERVVFFGRLEERKGVRPFVAALNALEPSSLARIELEFLGASTPGWSDQHVRDLFAPQTLSALRGVSFTHGLDREEALSHLDRPGTLAVMPSLEDNSPSTVYECLEFGIPFIASRVGGTEELIAPRDRERVLVDPTSAGIAGALRRALSGSAAAAEPAFDDDESVRRWEALVTAGTPSPRPTPVADSAVDVLVIRRSAADDPSAALEAIADDPHQPSSVTVIDAWGDGAAGAWRSAVHDLTAPWVVLLDARDRPRPGLVKTLMHAQASSGASVVTCGTVVRTEAEEPKHRLFAGEPRALGVLRNAYGTVALLPRTTLPEELPNEWALYATLSAGGAAVVSIPFALVERDRPPADIRTAPTQSFDVVRVVEGILPPPVRSLAVLAAGLAAAPAEVDPRRGAWARRLAATLGFRRA